ncbi:hypothetical protein CDLVIII_5415 [Clostridium sp. DL-VIII]|uniref:hypothetical protein n=1 Tax=Clostridium sp. DL-VIII TaxID=641107 RepID=UPI00023B0426|nr:hypothetical protein [Clostridium sp. DL-VIII]EHJ01897.1 hypothetical protein CDLVIII_5415 [Clostridium sp. DL-VIII]
MRKDIEADYTKDEFIKKYDIKEYDFKNDIEKFLDYFYLDKERLKRDSNKEGNYEIPYEISDLLSLMFKNFKNSPFYDKRYNLDTKNTDFTLNYIDKILSEIENLPDYLKYNIKKNPSYLFNKNLKELIPILIDKFTALFVLIASKSHVSAGNQLKELIKQLDNWINNYCLHDQMMKSYENYDIPILDIDDLQNIHLHDKYNYDIDSVLSKCLDEHLRDDTTNLPIDLPEDLKSKLLNLSKKGKKKRKPNEDELFYIRKEYHEFLNTFLNKEHFSKILSDIDNEAQKISNFNLIHPKLSLPEIENTLYDYCTTYNLMSSEDFHISSNIPINFKNEISNLKIDNICLNHYLERLLEAHKKDLEDSKKDLISGNYSLDKLNSEKNLRDELKKCASEIFNIQKNMYAEKDKLFKDVNSDPKYNLIKEL